MPKKSEGFTLIELLIVIGIITILASAVIIGVNPGEHFKQARNATRWSHMNSVMNTIYTFVISNNGNYPDCIGDEGEPVDLGECHNTFVEGVEDQADDYQPLVSEFPIDPSFAGSYDGDSITLSSTDDNGNDIPAVPGDWDGVDVSCSENCTGYIIGKETENSVRVISHDYETEATDVFVVQ